MEYALEYADKPDPFWDRVVFCDEKTFSTDDPTATQYVWRTPTTRFVTHLIMLVIAYAVGVQNYTVLVI